MSINAAAINAAAINAAGGAVVVYDVTETAVIVSTIATDYTYELETAIIANPEPSVVITATRDVTDPAVITNPEPVQVLSDTVTEAAVLNDVAYPANTTSADVAEVAVIVSSVEVSTTTIENVAETAVITSSATQSYPDTTVTETAVIISTVTPTGTGVLDVAETAVITSAVTDGLLDTVTETAVITSAVTALATSTIDVAETAVITSSDVPVSNDVLDIYETAVIASAAPNTVTARENVAEEGFISSEVYLNGEDAWTANTITWAMSTYAGIVLTGAAGRYAVSEDGLFEQSSSYANMNIATGRSDLGSDRLKTVPYAYVYAEHAAPLSISVTADVQGVENKQSYTQMARPALATRAVRCTLGRGFRSSYYKLDFTSSGYARVVKCAPVVTELSRRI